MGCGQSSVGPQNGGGNGDGAVGNCRTASATDVKLATNPSGNPGQTMTVEKLVSSSEVSLKSAVLIQKWYRRYKARLEARRRAAWVVYQSIEYSSESSQLHLHNFFNDMLRLGATDPDGGGDSGGGFAKRLRLSEGRTPDERELLERASFEDVEVDKSYSGPRLSFPLGASHVQILIDFFRQGGQLHARYLLQLLHETRLALQVRPNIYQASTSISKQVTVVGDLHGKLDDLLVIFYKNGLPDVTNPYVFNGDFVDRGPNSVEVTVLLLACQLVWPTAVCVNRGNHEDHVMNCRYGFIKEVQNKYRHYANKIVPLFSDVFAWLPLATIIDERILVAHGGISDKLDLGLLGRLDRHKYQSPLRPPHSETGKIDYLEWRQMLDLLWSDPKPQSGCRANTFRGGGCYFGPDVTSKFLQQNKLSMLVRSHECKPEGFEFCHDGSLLTIFSASNYYSEGSNRGAYVKFDNNGELHTVQFCSSKNSAMPRALQLSSVEDGAMRSLRAKIAATKTELVAAFGRLDPDKTGCLSVAQWCGVMEAELKLNLPWRTLRPHLAQLSQDGRVMYMSTFQRAAVQHRNGQAGQSAASPGESITEAVYKNKEELETIFRIMDRDSSGHISLDEFEECCRILCQATHRSLSDAEVTDMAKSMDLNSDGSIDFNEFLEAFRIVEFQHGDSLIADAD